MITVDSSALMAILLEGPSASACAEAERERTIKISAGTIAESLIVAMGRKLDEAMVELIDGLGADIVTVTATSAGGVAVAYTRRGRGFHPAALNFGDCFAYAVAAAHGRLLYVGNDFAKTDLESVLSRP